ASDAAAEDRFGNSVALSADGNTALVGAPFDDHSGGVEVGSAYVFTRSGSTWTEQARLQAPDAAAGDFFGISVALSADGSTALVGAYGDDNSGGQNAGSAYVFTRSGSAWSHQQRLQASDAGISDFFGVSVSLSADGNTALVGAYADDNSGGNDAGSAYVFTRSGSAWSEQQRLQASDAAVADQFGVSVDLSADGNTALVGAHHDDNSGGTDAGSAYVFTRSGGTWTEQQRVQASDAAAFDRFGVSVALNSDGSIALVGAYQDDNSGGMNAGSAYVFTRSGGTWTEQQRLQASDAAANDQFGGSVALSGDGNTALAGANQDTNSGGTFAGSAYVFTRSGPALTEQQRLQASDAAPGDSFGISVALNADGSTALVGAQLDDNSGGTDAGSAYPFAIEQPAQAGQVVISEFRMSGHGGTLDEYFELYNATDTPRDISGYTLHWSHSNAASGNSITIPAGTVIPARSHYLVTGSAYSLGPYAAPDQPFVGLPQNSAVGLFKPSDISAAGRVDSVAFNDLSPAGGFYAAHVEGTPLPQTGDSTVEHAWVRKLTSGRPQDTNDNAADFMLVAVTAGTVGPVQSVLGAPGPENLSSPLAKNAATQIASHLIDPCVSSSQQPNRQRVTGSYTDTLSGTGTYPLG
ncbi:MAG TPA: lamin tail domain-containing protein, partial [Pyrinomonadaceae bacterium]|nr:lamin tail domain-containing protein [Pyrinomonadaceae bacterium]